MTKKHLFTITTAIALLAALVSVAAAQGGPNNRGGNRPDDANMQNQADCPCDTGQMHAYQQGGMGIVDPETGTTWQGRGRGGQAMQAQRGSMGFYATLPPAVEGDVPQTVIDALNNGILDEWNAYNIYEAVIAQFGAVPPFVNIQQAEAQHAAALEFLFTRYDIALPEYPEAVDVTFDSLSDACQAAADAEIANFGLYDEALAAVSDYPDMVQVFTALRNASEFMHLPAFERCAS